MGGMMFITVENVSYQYGEVAALRDVSLALARGSFTAVMGANGSGKSTLARCLNGLLLPTTGRVLVDGMDTREHGYELRQRVGMVFQNPDNQLVAAVVEDDVAFGVENLGVPREEIRRRIDEALAAVGMSEYAHSAPHLLSGGQKQRVAIAGALAMQTECLVLDEPTSMLDPVGREDVMAVVRELHSGGTTIVLITHSPDEAAQAERVVLMAGGAIVREATPRELFGDVATVKRLGLEVPFAAEVAAKLHLDGIITERELVNALCQSK